MQWTPEQSRAIQTTGRGVIVSAGAGSGKTAVLAERCAHRVTDASPASSIDRLLVVTFTEAAAAEMRERIAAALRARLAGRPDSRRLQVQLALVEQASISTLHAFCRRVLLRFFAAAGFDPAFRVMDPHETALLRGEVLGGLFDDLNRGQTALAAGLDALIAGTGRGKDGQIREVVDSLAQFLDSIVDPEAWLREAGRPFVGAGGKALDDYWRNRRRELLLDELAQHQEAVAQQMDAIRRASPPRRDAFLDELEEYRVAVGGWLTAVRAAADGGALDGTCAGIMNYTFSRMPARSKDIEALPEAQQQAFGEAQSRFRTIRDELFKKRLQIELASFTDADWARGIAVVAPDVSTLIALVREFRRRFAAAKTGRAAVDFADLERQTLDLLRDPADPDAVTPAARWLRQQFDHVLVDEFQDINPVQAEILRRVSRLRPDGAEQNLFVVGDVKQSIYRFRLAEPELFATREQAGRAPADPGAPICIDLNRNFRSDAPLLALVNAVFGRLMDGDLGGIDYDDHARLVPGTPRQAAARGPCVELHLLEDVRTAGGGGGGEEESSSAVAEALDWERIEREACRVGRRIRELHDGPEAVPYRDMVVLLRSIRHHAPLMVRTLQRMGIPVFAELAGGFFETLEVRDVLGLLALLDNRQRDIELVAFLRSPLCPRPLNDSELVAVRVSAGRDVPFCRAALDYAAGGPRSAVRDKLADNLARLDEWRARARRRPLPDVIAELLRVTAYEAYVAALPEGAQRRANLVALHEYARRFATFSHQGLARFLQFMDELRAADTDLGAAPPLSAAADVVRLMSIHRSKGLEFPVVIVADLGRRFNLIDAQADVIYDRKLGIGLRAAEPARRIVYPTLPHRAVSRRARRQSLAEEMRVLYVALTRAKRRLILVGTTDLEKAAELRRSYVESAARLPRVVRESANCPLDWIIPALGSMPAAEVCWPGESPAARTLAVVRETTVAEMETWQLAVPWSPGVRGRLTSLARLEPTAAAPAGEPERARAVLGRLESRYPFETLTRVPAVVAASAMKLPGHIDEDDPAAVLPAGPPLARLRRPTFLGEPQAPADPARRGTWTHLFLQRLDPAAACDAADLRRQIDAMIVVGWLDEAAREAIDLDGVLWFLGSWLGAELRAAGPALRRETPFVYAVDASRLAGDANPAGGDDRVLVRGIIDCWFPAADGLVLLDYKTDAVGPDGVAARREVYRSQVEIYAEALADLARARVARRALVFLHPRQIETL